MYMKQPAKIDVAVLMLFSIAQIISRKFSTR